METTISVIIPVYNAENYLKRCLDSVINQTYKNLEIILIDDGSTDNSGEICDEYAKTDNRIKVIHKENGGVSQARNEGLRVATGEYIGFLDSDDFILHNMYENLIKQLELNDADISICGFAKEIEKGKFEPYFKYDTDCVFDRDEALKNLLQNKYYSCSCSDKLLKRSLLDNIFFDENITHYEDLLFLWQVIKKAKTVAFTSNVYYYYTTNVGSATQSKFSLKKMSMIDVCEYILEDSKSVSPEIYNVARTEFVRNNLMCAKAAVNSKFNDKASICNLRLNVKNNLKHFLNSYLSFGYKIRAVLISLSWRLFVMYVVVYEFFKP